MKGLKFIGILVLLFLFSCKKDQPITQQEPPPAWKKFVGTYQVYDTMGVYLHDMEVSHYSAVNQHGVVVDSLKLDNFNGMFEFGIQFQNISSNNILAIGIHNDLADNYGKRWHLSSWWDFPETPEIENALINDTIVFGFKLNNMAYYIHDVTPFYECKCRIVAVKQD